MAILQLLVVVILVAGSQAKSLVVRQGFGNNCPQACLFIFAPVCGSNGITYGNQCELEVAACEQAALLSDQPNFKPLTMVHEAPCGTQNRKRQFDSDCPMFCPEYYSPICGSNGQTYSNICFLEMASCQAGANRPNAKPITVAHQGGCNGEGGFETRCYPPRKMVATERGFTCM
ncbi:AGRN [Branchiostoma lanceolatum]|uniref:AGRN protein n=1 Tax=Branchiostoma lanceolatum TaxID=7740 RepID=A0A8J9Z4X7_BRALA|nr:AGRN [Branchiostoma lanceolatum]